jgi:hypothetical protein
MKVSPTAIAGIRLIAPADRDFETELGPLLGNASRDLLTPALPYSVIVANDSPESIALLGVRFDMTNPRGKPNSVVHYADTLRNPGQSDFLPGTRRFVCAEPSFTALLLRRDADLSSRGRNNLGNLKKMSGVSASIDCLAFADGRFEGPDTLGAFARLARQRESEAAFTREIAAAVESEALRLLIQSADDAADRSRRLLARKLLDALRTGHEEMLARAREHRLKLAVWRPTQK